MEQFRGKLDKISLQKLLFLFTLRQEKTEYDFIPDKCGCYSYSANADMKSMVTKELLSESKDHFIKLDKINYFEQLKPADQNNLLDIKATYGKMSAESLMRHTFINYPFYATKSEVAHDILNKSQLEKVELARPRGTKTVLYTIGYEGISLEEYLNRLLKNDVRVLVDVRSNPLSMKYGFSKSSLKRYCESLGIDYVHIPEVGIQSELRRELNTQSDYDNLFTIYRQKNLSTTLHAQTKILNLLKANQRIALTCFEANICQCHRKHLAEAIEHLPGFSYEVIHI